MISSRVERELRRKLVEIGVYEFQNYYLLVLARCCLSVSLVYLIRRDFNPLSPKFLRLFTFKLNFNSILLTFFGKIRVYDSYVTIVGYGPLYDIDNVICCDEVARCYRGLMTLVTFQTLRF